METRKLRMAPQRRPPSLALQIIRARNCKGSPLLTAWIKPLARWSQTAIKTTWAQDMDVEDTCEVRCLGVVGADTGAECLIRINLRCRPGILALRARPLHHVQCDKVSPIQVYCGNADSMRMGKHRLAVIHRRTLKGKPRLQSFTRRSNAILTCMQGEF